MLIERCPEPLLESANLVEVELVMVLVKVTQPRPQPVVGTIFFDQLTVHVFDIGAQASGEVVIRRWPRRDLLRLRSVLKHTR